MVEYDDIPKIIEQLFKEAEQNGDIEYIFTLVRVDGMAMGVPDPLIELDGSLLRVSPPMSTDGLSSFYLSMAIEEPLSLVVNLLNCTTGKPYQVSPFGHLYKGHFPNVEKPNPSRVAREVAKIGSDVGNSQICQLIDQAYPEGILRFCEAGQFPIDSVSGLKSAFEVCRSFLSSLLSQYRTASRLLKNSIFCLCGGIVGVPYARTLLWEAMDARRRSAASKDV